MDIYKKYKKTCNFLESVSRLETDLEYMKEREIWDLKKYLLRMQDLLDRLGNPEKDLNIIHVTGTSGKGTTVALIHRILQNSGYIVGSTLSPATTTTLERIKVNDLYINPFIFAEIVDDLKPIILDMYINGKYGRPSYFDLMFAIALVYFKQQRCDYVVLEVGMGGRWDSTNIIKNPIVTAITNIHFDHIHLLGNSLSEIAHEKAGIIKTGSIFFTTETDKEILEIFRGICKEQKVQFNVVSKGLKYYKHDSSQKRPNYILAEAITKYLGVKQEYIDSVFENMKLPCRFEKVSDSPAIILDGAHNVSKVAYSLEKLEKLNYKKLHVVFSAGRTKDAIGMLDLIAPIASSITLTLNTTFPGKSFSLKEMQKNLENNYSDIKISLSLESEKALEDCMASVDKDDAVLVIGSLYLAGALRKKWYSEEFIINNRKSF